MPHVGSMLVEAMPFGLRWVRLAMLPHLYKPLGRQAGPLPQHQETFCLSTKSWGQVDIFPLAIGVGSPQQLHNNITSLHDLGCSHATTPSSSIFHVDAARLHYCPIWASFEEVTPIRTLAVLGAAPKPLLYQGVVPGQCPIQLVISPSSHLRLRCY